MENQVLVTEICPTTTQKWIEKGAILLDVRERHEIEQIAFDVRDIINIPISEFEFRYWEVPKDKTVVVVCKAGVRSLRAAAFLIVWGYSRVASMKHGIEHWAQKGYPVKGDTSLILENEYECICPAS
ncbi:MAG: rhodanese-like domain-containing protein [Sphingobacteriaceae bacterium]|nr:rhodanese-like domain-containing protein [Sphingobacteriaceae bacterium]